MKKIQKENRVKLMIDYLGKLMEMKSLLGSFNDIDPGERIKNVCDEIELELNIKKPGGVIR